MAPGAHEHRAEDDQRDIGEDRDAEGEGHMKAHAQLAADLHLAQRPGHEGPGGADGDDLPEPALLERREAQTIFQVRRRYVDLPDVPGRADGRAIDDQGGPQQGEDRRRDAEEPDIEGANPEIEEVAANERAPPHPVFSFKTQHGHR